MEQVPSEGLGSLDCLDTGSTANLAFLGFRASFSSLKEEAASRDTISIGELNLSFADFAVGAGILELGLKLTLLGREKVFRGRVGIYIMIFVL